MGECNDRGGSEDALGPRSTEHGHPWNQVRPAWPNGEIHLCGAGVGSGTYDYFTEAIVGKEGASRGDFTSSEDDNVLVQGIAGDELALGFMGLAYFEQNRSRLKAVPIDDGNKENRDGSIAPSIETGPQRHLPATLAAAVCVRVT